jgi:hypothetical protein
MAASSDEEDGAEEFQSDDGWGAEDDFVSDSEDGVEGSDEAMVADRGTTAAKVPEVVFAPSVKGSLDVLSKAEKRAFLVSPISCEGQRSPTDCIDWQLGQDDGDQERGRLCTWSKTPSYRCRR